MKEIFSSSNVVELHFLQDEFQKNGISTEIQDKEISPSFSIKGGLPFPSNRLPSLWILHDEQYEEGKKILKQALQSGSLSSTSTRGWLCSQCEETNPEGFGICWNCGAPATENWVPYRETSKNYEREKSPSKKIGVSKRSYLFFVLLFVAGFTAGYYASRYFHRRPGEIDNNLDGKIDEWTIRVKRTKLPAISRDTNFDGKVDVFLGLDSLGRRSFQIEDTNFDGNPDIYIDFKNNLISWSQAFRKGMGDPRKGTYDPNQKPVLVKHYVNGFLSEEWVDDDEDGTMDRKITYDYLGKMKSEEKIGEDKMEWWRLYKADHENSAQPKVNPPDDFNPDTLAPPPKHPLQF